MKNTTRFHNTALALLLGATIITGPHANAQNALQIEIVPLTQHGDQVMDLRLSDDERLVLTDSQDETIKLWDYTTGRLIRTLDRRALGISQLDLVDVVPNLRYMVAAHEDGTLKVWDLEVGAPVRVLAEKLGEVVTVRITSDGTGVITAQENGPFKVWDFQSGKLKLSFGGPASLSTEVLPADDSILVLDHDKPIVEQ